MNNFAVLDESLQYFGQAVDELFEIVKTHEINRRHTYSQLYRGKSNLVFNLYIVILPACKFMGSPWCWLIPYLHNNDFLW